MTETTTIHQLADRLREAAQAYYDTDTLLMSDEEYDDGIEQLRIGVAEDPSLEGEFNDLLDQVAAGQSEGGDVEHPTLMGSMLKVPTTDAVRKFVAKVSGPVVVEPKLDGLAARAVYTNGKLTLVATRGDGRTGENITTQARNLQLLPEDVAGTSLEGKTFELRGEVFMAFENFPKANKIRTAAGSEEFVNTRNASAGILRKGDTAYAGMLTFAVYGVTGLPESTDHRKVLRMAEEAGAVTSLSLMEADDLSSEQTSDVEEVLKQIEKIGEHRATLGYPTDGAVVKAVDAADRERLGEGSTAPHWAVAYKYKAEEAQTVVTDIVTGVGRTGRLSLTIEVEPVFVGGATVARASGHNVSWMLEKDIRIGDTVKLRRANDVIPYVSEVVLEERPDDSVAWEPPATDPEGNEWDKSSLLWRSTSPGLSVLAGVVYATSRDCLDVEFLGEEILTALVEQGLVKELPDLFHLTEKQLAQLKLNSGRVVGEATAVKIIKELERAKTADWNRVITSLGIRATGRTMGRRLAKAFPTMDQLRAATTADLAEVDGIASKKAEIIHDGLQTLATTGMLDRLAATGLNMGTDLEDTGDALAPLDGQQVVVTGKVGGLTRTQVQERIESLGGKASGSVSKNTTLLVAEPGSTSSKVKKAEGLGIKIITPDDFLAL